MYSVSENKKGCLRKQPFLEDILLMLMITALVSVLMMHLMLMAAVAAVFNHPFQEQPDNFGGISGTAADNLNAIAVENINGTASNTSGKHY